jgi:hypothetical protein
MGRILMTLATLIYGVIPPIVDLGATHVFHPDWTPHARMHMVWLLGTMSSIAVLALYFLWAHVERRMGIRMAGILGLCCLGGFFLSAATTPMYGGALNDVGGVPDVAGLVDANLLGFGIAALLLLVGWVMAYRQKIVGASSSAV